MKKHKPVFCKDCAYLGLMRVAPHYKDSDLVYKDIRDKACVLDRHYLICKYTVSTYIDYVTGIEHSILRECNNGGDCPYYKEMVFMQRMVKKPWYYIVWDFLKEK
jgi:hypothetical protein